MRARSALLTAATLLVAPLLAAPLAAQRVEYVPGTTAYHVTTSTKGTQSSPMGNQDFELTVQQRITVGITRQSTDTLVATLTIDSISIKSAGPAPDVSHYQGTKISALIAPTGRVYSSKPLESADPMLAQLSEAVLRFLPRHRTDLHTGLAWSDTTTGKIMQQGLQVDRTIIADYTVMNDTTFGGEKAFNVKRHTATKAEGSGAPSGNAIALETSTTSDANIFLNTSGVYLGSNSNDDIALKLTLIAQGAEVNVKQKATQMVRAIR